MTILVSNGQSVDVGSRPFPTGFPRTVGPSAGLVPLLSANGERRAATYEAMVRAQPWVFAAVRTLVKGAALVPLQAYDGEDASDRKRVRGPGLPRLLTRPFPRSRGTALMMRLWWDYYVHGHALQLKSFPTPGASPEQLWPVPWKYVQKIEDDFGVLGFNVVLGGHVYPLSLDDVAYYPYMTGIAPIESLFRTLALEDASIDWQSANMSNGISKRAAFNIKNMPRDPDDQRKLREELKKLYSGNGEIALVGGEMTATELGVSAVDLAVIEQRKLSREEVAGAFGVTPPLMGILDRATFNNVAELITQHYVLAMGPDLASVAEAFQAQVIDPYPEWDGLYVEFNTDVVLKPTPLVRAQMHMLMSQSSTSTTNERRKYENSPPIGDPNDPNNPANIPTRQLAQVPITTPVEPTAAPADSATASGLNDQLVRDAMLVGSSLQLPAPKEGDRT